MNSSMFILPGDAYPYYQLLACVEIIPFLSPFQYWYRIVIDIS